MKPKILFFARDYQSFFFPLLKSDKYDSIYIVKTIQEKKNVLKNGGDNVFCFEEEFEYLNTNFLLESYLEYSYGCDRFYKGLSLLEREQILKKEISFVRSILERFEPKYIINETVAIELAEVLAIEAKKLNIKYLSWMSFPKKNTFYWQENPFHNSLKKSLDKIIPTEKELSEAQLFIDGIKDGLIKPFYVEKTSKRTSIFKLFQLVKSLLLEMIIFITNSKLKRKVILGGSLSLKFRDLKLFANSLFYSHFYDNIDDFNDKELIFYPLHFEPEALLFYMAYFFDNQVTVIENALKCLNQNQFLVVKEHPQQLGMLLEKRFRKIKQRYPNLLFIRGEEKTVQVINKCTVVITLGSTAGFEAIALGKKVINLGRIFYDSFEGVNNCKSFEEVYDLFRGNKLFNKQENFEIFVAKMLQYVNKGNPFPHSDLYSDSNIELVRKAIENELIK
ncbi:hypothetical protein [Sediminibacterium sp. C3]|uniref:capsular polysaccharide export protein, LipB/KpsS family n=1 Tax=Sediminibacterium sp. C3 TaxID=1267211 RepID=UPI0004063C35|nr:hypothetical protein [Sediminibacterium sp. C3]